MADPVIDAAVAAPVATPAPAAPAAAEAAPAPSTATAAPVAPIAEAAPTPAPTPAPAAAAEPTSILSDAKSSAEPAPPVVVTPPVEAVAPAPLPPPTYEAFKLPDGVALDETKVTEFTKLLGEYEAGPKDHAQTQALGQRMVDFFVAEQQRAQTELVNSFEKIREGWRSEIKADATFGGEKYTKTIADAATVIEQYGGSPEEVAALRQMFRITGAGDNPHMIRMLARLGKAAVREGSPVPATVPKSPNTVSKSAKRYSTSLNGSGN